MREYPILLASQRGVVGADVNAKENNGLTSVRPSLSLTFTSAPRRRCPLEGSCQTASYSFTWSILLIMLSMDGMLLVSVVVYLFTTAYRSRQPANELRCTVNSLSIIIDDNREEALPATHGEK
jgi:hypothetical protein